MKRASSPTCCATQVRKAITSCLVTASIASIASTSIFGSVCHQSHSAWAALSGTTPSSPSFSVACASISNQMRYRASGSQIAVIAGRVGPASAIGKATVGSRLLSPGDRVDTRTSPAQGRRPGVAMKYHSVLLCSAALLCGTPALAGEEVLYQPAPAWVEPAELPSLKRGPPIVLYDDQRRIEEGRLVSYLDRA